MYSNYADVLESYMIAEEGIMDRVKSAGSKIFDGIKMLIQKIKDFVKKIKDAIKRKLGMLKNNDYDIKVNNQCSREIMGYENELSRIEQNAAAVFMKQYKALGDNENAYIETRTLDVYDDKVKKYEEYINGVINEHGYVPINSKTLEYLNRRADDVNKIVEQLRATIGIIEKQYRDDYDMPSSLRQTNRYHTKLLQIMIKCLHLENRIIANTK